MASGSRSETPSAEPAAPRTWVRGRERGNRRGAGVRTPRRHGNRPGEAGSVAGHRSAGVAAPDTGRGPGDAGPVRRIPEFVVGVAAIRVNLRFGTSPFGCQTRRTPYPPVVRRAQVPGLE